MEGIPRVPMFSLELLTPEKPLSAAFEENMREYIVINYQDDPSKYNRAFQELETMRNVLMQNVANVETICIMKRYFAQLSMVKARFPMEDNDPLATQFSWVDRAFDMSSAVVYNDVNFELCCVLYNIGAAHAIIAAGETRSDPDSIKNAFMHFQYASWPMKHLRDEMRAANYNGMCFAEPFITFYMDMFLAQAQECILEKSMIDGRKPLVIAKVAAQLKKFYDANLEKLNVLATELTSIGRYKALFRLVSAKAEFYDALSYYYMGLYAENEKEMGLRVSYLAYALERITAACNLASKDERDSLRQALKYAYDVIFQKEDNARKENDFIYHSRITKHENFEPIEGVIMVKPIGFDINDPSVYGEDLFASLLPTGVLKTVSMYSEEKTKFRRQLLDRVQEKDNELESFLVSLRLSQLHLDEPIESVRLPDELLSSSAAFSAQPNAFPTLIDKFDEITKLASEAERKLARLTDRVKNIETPALVSDVGFCAIRAKVDELNGHHIKARENNTELQRAIAAHSENLKLLAMPLAQLSKEICGEYINPMEHEEGKELRRILDKVDEMRRQRCKLVQTLDEDLNADDITTKALANRDFHPQELFERELKKHEKTANIIQQNLIAQEKILNALTDANANFADFRRRITDANEKRVHHSLTLVTAYQIFVDVVDKTDKALAFYKQLFAVISALSKGVSVIEEIEDNKKKETERLAKERRMAKESADAIQEFACTPVNNRPIHSATTTGPIVLPAVALTSRASSLSTAARPKLSDYMDFYRNKMAATSFLPASPAMTMPMSSPSNASPMRMTPVVASSSTTTPIVGYNDSSMNGYGSAQIQASLNSMTPQTQQQHQYSMTGGTGGGDAAPANFSMSSLTSSTLSSFVSVPPNNVPAPLAVSLGNFQTLYHQQFGQQTTPSYTSINATPIASSNPQQSTSHTLSNSSSAASFNVHQTLSSYLPYTSNVPMNTLGNQPLTSTMTSQMAMSMGMGPGGTMPATGTPSPWHKNMATLNPYAVGQQQQQQPGVGTYRHM